MTNRQTLFSAVNSTVTASLGLGAYNTGPFTRFAGLFQTVGSLTLTYRMGVSSGVYQVSSALAINSGSTVVDVLAYGRVTEFGWTAVQSTQWSGAVFGQVQR